MGVVIVTVSRSARATPLSCALPGSSHCKDQLGKLTPVELGCIAVKQRFGLLVSPGHKVIVGVLGRPNLKSNVRHRFPFAIAGMCWFVGPLEGPFLDADSGCDLVLIPVRFHEH